MADMANATSLFYTVAAPHYFAVVSHVQCSMKEANRGHKNKKYICILK